jgi:hypothetical protein
MKTTPGPWRVSEEWLAYGGGGKDPAAILGPNDEPVIESSEWLTLSKEDAFLIVDAVNKARDES